MGHAEISDGQQLSNTKPNLQDTVALWSRSRDSWLACHEFEPSSTKFLCAEGPMHVKYVEAQTSPVWVVGKLERRVPELRCSPHHLTMVQNYEVRHQ
ncbi:hypothetical protein TNCV_1875011 [Trichonephila clavipes]|nr:hypothetical protein TNCV_1875011 [Trichonephila clavipes]